MVRIIKKKGENNDAMFRKLNRIMVDDEFSKEFRDRQFFVKPSQVRKEKEKNRGKKHRKTN